MWRHQNPLEGQSNFLHHENFLQDWTWKVISDVIFNFSKNVTPNNRLLITRKMTHRMTHPQIENKNHREIVKSWREKVPIEKWRYYGIFLEVVGKNTRFEISCPKIRKIYPEKLFLKFRASKMSRILQKTKCASKISQWTIVNHQKYTFWYRVHVHVWIKVK